MVGIRTQPGRLRKVRKSVFLLQDVGCVDSKRKDWQELFSEPPDPESEFSLPYHGWGITEKALETEEYKKAWEAEEKLLREVFGDDAFPDGLTSV